MFGETVYNGWLKVFRNSSKREIVQTTDSVAFLIYLRDTDQVVTVQQERAPMASESNPAGLIIEMPAGRFDVNLTAEGLIAKEAKEEIGAKIELKAELLNYGGWLALSPGVLTERMILGFVETSSDQLEADRVFGVDENERIKRLLVPVVSLPHITFQDMKTFALVQWFLNKLRAEGRVL